MKSAEISTFCSLKEFAEPLFGQHLTFSKIKKKNSIEEHIIRIINSFGGTTEIKRNH